MNIRMILGHDGTRWIACNDSFTATGRTFADLDLQVASALRAESCENRSRVTVSMDFDFTAFPIWMRQYASHYFNRSITFDL